MGLWHAEMLIFLWYNMNCSTGYSVKCGLEGKKQNKSIGSWVHCLLISHTLEGPWGVATHVDPSQERSPWETEVRMTLKSNLMIQWVLLELQEFKWEVIYRNRYDSKTAASPGPPRHGDSSQIWEPGVHCRACRQLDRLESVLSGLPFLVFWASLRHLGWFLLLPDWLDGLRVFFAALHIWEQLSSVLFTLGRAGTSYVSFRNFLKLFWVVYFPA